MQKKVFYCLQGAQYIEHHILFFFCFFVLFVCFFILFLVLSYIVGEEEGEVGFKP